MKNVLVLAYYFPPFGLSGVQRVAKFVKYLPDFGWKPTVLTIVPHAYLAFDDTLLQELEDRNLEIWRVSPGKAFSVVKERKLVTLKNERLRKVLNRASQFFFIPDNKIGWKKQALEFLEQRDLSGFDAVFSTAPPFTNHLIGTELKEKYGLPLVLDFRDSWFENPFHIYWTPYHRRKHEALERKVFESADALVATNPVMIELWKRRYPKEMYGRMSVIEHGFDPEDFENVPLEQVHLQPEEVNFVYTGIFYERTLPLPLYEALRMVKEEHPNVYRRLRFYMVGYVQDEFKAAAERIGVADRFVYCGYVDHAIAVAWIMRGDIVWLTLGAGREGYKTMSPGKAFDYLGSRKPILALLDDSSLKDMLTQYQHTFVVPPGDVRQIAIALVQLASMKSEGTLPHAQPDEVEYYSRREKTRTLAMVLEKVTKER